MSQRPAVGQVLAEYPSGQYCSTPPLMTWITGLRCNLSKMADNPKPGGVADALDRCSAIQRDLKNGEMGYQNLSVHSLLCRKVLVDPHEKQFEHEPAMTLCT